MVNVSITNLCNRQCSYCFARGTLDRVSGSMMSMEQFDEAIDFVQRSGFEEIRILGGEPTIHPRFVEMLDRSISRGFRVLVFTGGMMPDKALDRMQGLSAEQLTVLLNVAIAGESPEREIERQRHVMSLLGNRVVLGLNIHSPGVDLPFLLDLVQVHRLSKQVRLGIAHPLIDGQNLFLHPRHFEEVGRRVADFVVTAGEAGVHVIFDCGWVRCMFPEGSLDALGIGPEEIGLRCNPILDVLSDGRVISCYSLGEYPSEQLEAWENFAQLAEHFSDRLSPRRSLGVFRRCAECRFREQGECVGGCLSLAMRRLRERDFESVIPGDLACDGSASVSLPQLPVSGGRSAASCEPHASGVFAAASTYCKTRMWAIPYIDQPLSFWEEMADVFGGQISHVYLPLPDSQIGSGRPVQPYVHAQLFLRNSSLTKAVLLNVATLPDPVPVLARRIAEDLRRTQGEYGVTEAIVANLQLALRLRDALPSFSFTASVLMDITQPSQARLLNDVCSVLVPGSSILRDLPALQAVRDAFRGRIRLLVNEACLPFCPYRAQHFREMAEGAAEPQSLCSDLLDEQPWLRLTGSWILPQHLHLLESLYDGLKLAGRVTLSDPVTYRYVFHAYLHRRHLLPSEIGGGPSSVLEPIEMPEDLYRYTLVCGRKCHECTRCPDYYRAAVAAARDDHVQPQSKQAS